MSKDLRDLSFRSFDKKQKIKRLLRLLSVQESRQNRRLNVQGLKPKKKQSVPVLRQRNSCE